MRRAELVAAVLMAAFSIYLMWKSTELEVGWVPGEGPGGGFWPFWLAAGMLVSCVWIIVNWVRRTSPPSRSEEPFFDSYGLKMFCLVGGGITAMIALVHVVGMHLALAAFFVYYIRFLGKHSWKTTLSIAIPAPIVVFLFFDLALRKFLPTGLVEDFIYLPIYDAVL